MMNVQENYQKWLKDFANDEETVKEYTSGAAYGYRKYTYVGDCCIKMTGIIGH